MQILCLEAKNLIHIQYLYTVHCVGADDYCCCTVRYTERGNGQKTTESVQHLQAGKKDNSVHCIYCKTELAQHNNTKSSTEQTHHKVINVCISCILHFRCTVIYLQQVLKVKLHNSKALLYISSTISILEKGLVLIDDIIVCSLSNENIYFSKNKIDFKRLVFFCVVNKTKLILTQLLNHKNNQYNTQLPKYS